MQRSIHRILTTHVGSLARPEALMPLLRLKERGQPYDTEAFARLVHEAAATVVHQQVAAGRARVTEGEQGQERCCGSLTERFHGFERQPVPPGHGSHPRAAGRADRAVPDSDAWSERLAASAGGRGGDRPHGLSPGTGPLRDQGHAAVQAARATLKTARHGGPQEAVLLPAMAPSSLAATLPKASYRSAAESAQALCDARREEYHAIVAAGCLLQSDAPRLVSSSRRPPERRVADGRHWAARRIAAIHDASRDIPPEPVRFHTWYRIDGGPRLHAMALQDMVDILLQSTVGA